MNWPDPSDYQDAIQNPRTCFQDPDLKAGSVALTPLGLPRVMSGNFASVYEVRSGQQRWAVRCFLRQVSDQQRRYSLLSQHLSGLWLPILVGFEYLPQGIRVRGQWYPIVKMEWVEGEALHTFVGRHLNDAKTLLMSAAQWRGLVNSLRGNRLAHGDLQHGNVLVTQQGQMRLVDYDAMFVPSLRGEESPELGHPNYQHPKREPTDYNEGLDNFSALVIYTSLRALAVERSLWNQFHTGENLILSATDYKTPQQSVALSRLKRSPDVCVQKLAAQLEQCCLGSAAQAPEFETIVAALPTQPQPVSIPTVTAPTTSTTAPPPRPTTPTSPQPQTTPWWQTTPAQPSAPTVRPQPTQPPPLTRTQPQPVQTSQTTPTPAPGVSQPHNVWAWTSLALVVLSFVLYLWTPATFASGLLGLASITSGFIGWRVTRNLAGRGKWMAGTSLGLGIVMVFFVFILLTKSQRQKPESENKVVVQKEQPKKEEESVSKPQQPEKPTEVAIWDGLPKFTLPSNPTPEMTFTNPIDGAVMIYVQKGEFLMGSDKSKDSMASDNELPQRKVYLDGYWIYKHEVTVAQYRKFCNETGRQMPSAPSWGWDNHPIVNVTWNDAVAYCNWAGVQLPTEAQWEKAARGTDGRIWPWGNQWDASKCNSYNNTGPTKQATPVGNYPQDASPYGVMDMAGNVCEWCADWYDKNYYASASNRNPQGPSSGTYRVLRGGSYGNNVVPRVRAAYRYRLGPDYSSFNWGFRCASSRPR